MAVELYRQPEAGISNAAEADLSEVTESRALAEAAGWLPEWRVNHANQLFRQFTPRQTQVWDGFLPYAKCGCEDCDELTEYLSTGVPDEAREAIAWAEQTELFDFLQIWVPAEDETDLLCVGVIGHSEDDLEDWHIFPIARWGETLPPYHEIEETVIDQALAAYDPMAETGEAEPAASETTLRVRASGQSKGFDWRFAAVIGGIVVVAAAFATLVTLARFSGFIGH